MIVQPLRQTDLMEYHRLISYAFSNFTETPKDEDWLRYYDPKDAIGVYENEQLVAGMVNHPLLQSIHGRLLRCGGIGAVASWPEQRRRGYVRAMIGQSFAHMRITGQYVSALSPFKPTFYAQFGYVTTTPWMRIEFTPEIIRPYLRFQAEGYALERVCGSEANIRFHAFLTRHAPAMWHGAMFSDTASHPLVTRRMKDALLVFVTHAGQDTGVICYRKTEADHNVRLVADDFLWTDDTTRKMMLHYLALHIEHANRIALFIPYGTRFTHWFRDIGTDFETKVNGHPWMVRIVDVEKAMSGYSAHHFPSAIIRVSDRECPWNNRIFTVSENHGQLHIVPDSGHPDTECGIDALTHLFYGTLPVSELREMELLDNHPLWDTLQQFFPVKPSFNTFWF